MGSPTVSYLIGTNCQLFYLIFCEHCFVRATILGSVQSMKKFKDYCCIKLNSRTLSGSPKTNLNTNIRVSSLGLVFLVVESMTLDNQEVFKVFHFFLSFQQCFAHLLLINLFNCMYTDYIYIIPKSPISFPNPSHISPAVSKMYHYFLFITITYI